MAVRAALFLFFVLFFPGQSVEAKSLVTIEPIGAHYPIFVVEKNENPQNVLVAYTKLGSNCELQTDPKTKMPILDYYWMMERKTYKPVHRFIKGGIQDRLSIDSVPRKDTRSFQIHMNDLKELDQDLKDATLTVTATQVQGKPDMCDVSGVIQLGASDHDIRLRLDSIYSESKTTLLPPWRKVVAVTLIGVNAAAPKTPLRRKYLAR